MQGIMNIISKAKVRVDTTIAGAIVTVSIFIIIVAVF